MTVRVIEGDCRKVLAALPAASVDAIVTDPPYELGFMGKGWDKSGIAFDPDTWRAALRVLKPGGHLLAFGGSRTYHRLACAIEDAGFEVRDQIFYCYGSGFPKSHNIGDGRGTALKPAHEPIVLARKPLTARTVASNVVQFGTGALNVDACRVPTNENQTRPRGSFPYSDDAWGDGRPNEVSTSHPLGRWPANLIHDGSDEVEAAFAAFGERKSGSGNRSGKVSSQWRDELKPTTYERDYPASTGTASRFFMACKSSEGELLFSHAKAIMRAWNNVLVNTADDSSSLSSELAASALNDAAIWASQGAIRLSDVTGLFTSVTPSELSRISESFIAAILSLGGKHSPEPLRDGLILNGCRVKLAATQKQIGTTTITISHWKSDGSAAPVTFSITQENSEHGERGLNGSDRFRYCAKASKRDRDDGLDGERSTHPTVKPTELMRYLCRLVTPPGGTVLDPFAGSGSTGRGAVLEGFNFIGAELSPEYADIARRRIKAAQRKAQTPLKRAA